MLGYADSEMKKARKASARGAGGAVGSRHRQLRASLQDPLHDPLGIADEKRDGDVGVFLLEAADEGRQDVLAGDRAGGDNELPAHAALELVEGLARLAVKLENPPPVAPPELPGLASTTPQPRALEEAPTQLFLEPANV